MRSSPTNLAAIRLLSSMIYITDGVQYPRKAGYPQDAFILNVLFTNSDQTVGNRYAATMLCALSFVEWCKKSVLDGNLPGELLLRFAIECHVFKILSGDYFTDGYISNTPISMVHYWSIAKTALFGCAIDSQTSLLLSLFGFRQAFENRCKRMIGYLGADPVLKYHDGVFAEVLGGAAGLKDHAKAPHVSIRELAKLADWTNVSIHNQIIPPSWMIWKLFDLSEWFFSPPKMEDESQSWNLYGHFSCSVDDLQKMRDDFVLRIKQAVQQRPSHRPKEYALYWDNSANHLELVIENKQALEKLEVKTIVLI